MSNNYSVLKFDKVSFNHGYHTPILDEVSFVLRRGSKMTLMGQNGAGKSTIFSLITGENKPEEGKINIEKNATIAIAKQVIPRDQLDLKVEEFFALSFPESEEIYNIYPKIDKVLEAVNLEASYDRQIKSFSGGQQSRLLLASALIQNPDILLLDEPTNNLDKVGIDHLTKFLVDYKKTCLVISHDADFLNEFTEGVLYLDKHTHKLEQYNGDYHDVVKIISARIEKEIKKNAQLEKTIQDKKDKANFFAKKGGRLRMVAKRMRDLSEELEESKVDVRKEDKTIRDFIIPAQDKLPLNILTISSIKMKWSDKPKDTKINIDLQRGEHLQLTGPNGIGKSTLLESLAETFEDSKESKNSNHSIASDVKVGYYRQDFSTLDFNKTTYETLSSALGNSNQQEIRSTAAGFLITEEFINTKIGNLSEGQKGLVAFTELVLMRPGLLILDEPTNHINFRHLPVIAKALDKYEGAMIIVSHVPEFINQIKIDKVLDLEKAFSGK